ncbi:MAG: DEAD/DEAH box helicase, partial [Planctomycetes bacterium]|nr:DEAD/DEAH box helicase [Planctomycetota bacterium]
MMGLGTRPDVQKVLRGLKDFQRETVDLVFRRMYTDGDATRRFLLADEVGLGKTLVCKGLIAKVIDHLWEKADRIDVLYVCSNADIARQNIRRLGSAGRGFTHAHRITLLPVTIGNLARNKVNFISITPGTSLDLKSQLGTAEERALLHCLLRGTWDDIDAKDLADILRGNVDRRRFRDRVKWFPEYYRIDRALAQRFSEALVKRAADDEAQGKQGVRARLEHLAEPFCSGRSVDSEPWDERARLVGDLRGLLARSCLDALEPDLVILDEFQRFKHLLDGEDPASELAQQIFTFGDVRVLLVSATPYKMYTVDEEAGGDDHHRDFVQTLRFLCPSGDAGVVEGLLGRYRREMFSLASGGGSDLATVKGELEQRLRSVMVRTERLAATPDRNGMLHHVESAGLPLRTEDLRAFLGLQEVSELVGQRDTIEYWKSAPYLLNFMDGYELKKALERTAAQPARAAEVARVLARTRGMLLPTEDMKRYAAVDPGNGRLRHLAEDTLGRGAWRVLWMRPAMPYVQAGAPFDAPGLACFTKRLVFSSWRVVPKTIACLLSYEAERLAFQSLERDAENTPEARDKRKPLLRIARAKGRLVGMPLMGL